MQPSHSITLSSWAQRQAPRLTLVAHDITDPTFGDHNLVAILDDVDDARDLVSRWEFVDERVGDVGLVVLGTEDPAVTPRTQVDAPGVVTDAGRKALKGAVPGALIGALVFGVVGAVTGGAALAAALAVGGAFFIGLSSAVWAYVMSTRSTSAYEQSFVDPEITSLVAVSLHADDDTTIESALESIGDIDAIALHVERDGSTRRIN